MTDTAEAQALKPRTAAGHPHDPQACARCGGQLAFIRGRVMAQPDPRKPPADEDSDRGRRQFYVGCGTCAAPVPLDHPRQLDLDRRFAEQDRRDAAEKARGKAALPVTPPSYELNPVRALEERVEFLAGELAKAARRIAALESEASLARQQAALSQQAARRKG